VARVVWGGRTRPPLAQHEVDIAQVDEHAEPLAGDEHRIAARQRVDEQQQAAADREPPERRRNDAAARAFRRDPLNEETRREQRLRRKAEHDPPIELRDKDVMQIVL